MLYDAESGDFVLGLLGDVMPTRRLAVFHEERYLKLKETLASSDATFANLETTVHEYFQGHHGISGGTYMTTEPQLLDELKWLGVSFVSCANNHAFDYGEEGVLATMRYLEAAKIPHAGTGRNLRDVLELDAKVNVAIDGLKARGFESPYLRTFVVARINPLRWKRGATGDFDPIMDKMLDAIEAFDVEKIRLDQVRAG